MRPFPLNNIGSHADELYMLNLTVTVTIYEYNERFASATLTAETACFKFQVTGFR